MKSHKIKSMVGVLLVILFAGTSSSFGDTILWQIGQKDGAVDEFNTNPGAFINDFTYDFGFVSRDNPTKITSATPSYLFSEPYPFSAFYATDSLNIKFEIGIAYDELFVNFGRFGSELNQIYLDGTEIATIAGPGEGILSDYRVLLNDVDSGAHRLTIAYAGGGSNNGHYIDYVQLENGVPRPPSAVPEPATILLLGAGLVGLAGFGRQKFK